MSSDLRVMTFNLRRDVEADGAFRWDLRREAVAQVVLEHAPDVLGTQEGLPHQLAFLDERLPAYRRVGRGRDAEGQDEACAIYYRADRFTLRAWGDLWLSDEPAVPGSRTWGNRHPRLVTWAQLLDARTGETFTVANTHLDHESEEARQRAAHFLAARLPNAVLMGDFNAEPGDETHRILTAAGFCDAYVAHADPTDAAHTFHGFTGNAWVRLDWVLAPAGHKVQSHRVPVRGVPASDHHPVVVDLVRAR